ncbi:unnamed protein product, partial [Lymnaea stagnalis]
RYSRIAEVGLTFSPFAVQCLECLVFHHKSVKQIHRSELVFPHYTMDLDLLLTHINAVNLHTSSVNAGNAVVGSSSNNNTSRHYSDLQNNNSGTFTTTATVHERPNQLPVVKHLPPQPPARTSISGGSGGRHSCLNSPAHSPTSPTPSSPISAAPVPSKQHHHHSCRSVGNTGVALHPSNQHNHPHHPHHQLLQLPQLPTQYAAPLLYHMQTNRGSTIKRNSSYHGPNSLATKFRHSRAVRRPSGSLTYVR